MELADWRKQQEMGDDVLLPSGLRVRVRRVSLMDLAVQGAVPTPLVAQVNTVMDKGLQNITVETAAKYEGAINLVVMAAIITPPVREVGSADAVGIRELSMVDRLAIFRECNRYGEALKPFRTESEVPVESA